MSQGGMFELVQVRDGHRTKTSWADFCDPREGDVAGLFIFRDKQRVRVSIDSDVAHRRRYYRLWVACADNELWREHRFLRKLTAHPEDWQGPMEQDQLTRGGYQGARYFATFHEIV